MVKKDGGERHRQNPEANQRFKCLEDIMDDQMRWEDHIESITKILLELNYIFYSLRLFLIIYTLRCFFYCSLFQSVATYGIMGWGCCAASILYTMVSTKKTIAKDNI